MSTLTVARYQVSRYQVYTQCMQLRKSPLQHRNTYQQHKVGRYSQPSHQSHLSTCRFHISYKHSLKMRRLDSNICQRYNPCKWCLKLQPLLLNTFLLHNPGKVLPIWLLHVQRICQENKKCTQLTQMCLYIFLGYMPCIRHHSVQ